mgnify:FL=1
MASQRDAYDLGDITFGSFNLPPPPGADLGTEWDPAWVWNAFLKPYKQSPLGNFLSRRYQPNYNRYLGELPYNPQLTWEDWLRSFNPEHEFAYTSPFERGETPSAFLGRSRRIG